MILSGWASLPAQNQQKKKTVILNGHENYDIEWLGVPAHSKV